MDEGADQHEASTFEFRFKTGFDFAPTPSGFTLLLASYTRHRARRARPDKP